MVVQRKWMYLEGIFVGGDIRSQLPEEAKKFDQIDKTFKSIMTETHKQPNIKIGKWLTAGEFSRRSISLFSYLDAWPSHPIFQTF